MAAPVEIPAGWTVEIRTRKSGRTAGTKDKYYIHPTIGYKFRSKAEIFRYLEFGILGKGMSASMKRCTDLCTNDKTQLVVVQTEDLPDWLPKGWITKIYTRKNGLRAGQQYKCYIDPLGFTFYSGVQARRYLQMGQLPTGKFRTRKRIINETYVNKVIVPAENSTDGLRLGWTKEIKVSKRSQRRDALYIHPTIGYKFRSDAEIFRYLESGNFEKGMSASMNCTDLCINEKTQPVVVQTEDLPDWLPKGWITKIFTRKRGPQAGRQYKCYIDPLGITFYSEVQARRYLQTGQLPTGKLRARKRRINEIYVNKAIASAENSPDGLPPGWIKEIKFSRRGQHRDPYYIDPVTGYVFRSKPDVFRYLETGKLGRHVSKPNNSKGPNFTPPTAAIIPKLMGSTTRRVRARRTLFMTQCSKPEQANDHHSSHDSNLYAELVTPISSVPPNLEYSGEKPCMPLLLEWEEKKKDSDVLSNTETKLKTMGSSELPVGSEGENLKEDNLSLKLVDNNYLLENRASLNNGDLPEMQDKKVMEISVRPELKDGTLSEEGVKKCEIASAQIRSRSSKTKTEKVTLMPCRRSKRLAGLVAEVDPGFTDCKRTRRISAAKEAAYPKSNTAKDLDQVAYPKSNTAEELGQVAYVKFNTAEDLDQVAYPKFNTAEDLDQVAYSKSNAAEDLDQVAYPKFNTPEDLDQVAYPKSNTPEGLDQVAYPKSNTPEDLDQVAYPKFNTAEDLDQVAYPKSNTPDDLDQVAYPKFNTPKDLDQVAYPTSNTAEDLDQVAYPKSNTPEGRLEQVAYPKSNTPEDLDQVAYPKSNTPEYLDQVAYPKSNAAEDLDQVAYPESNTPKDLDQVPYPKSTTPEDLDQVPYPKSNTPEDLDQVEYPKSSTAEDLDQVAYAKPSTPEDLGQVAYPKSSTLEDLDQVEYLKSNTAEDLDQVEYPKSSTAEDLDQVAYPKSSTPEDLDQVAYPKSSTPEDLDQVAYPKSSTPDDLVQVRNEIPVSEMTEFLPTACPFGDFWPDPCVEFAYKTLTDAISVESLLQMEYFGFETWKADRKQQEHRKD